MTNQFKKISFNVPCLSGNEIKYIEEAIRGGKISGDGVFTQNCIKLFKEKFNFQRALLTTSCTDALEMSAILLNIQPGDEVIAPSYTFVSTVNAFALRGAKIVFADSGYENPNIEIAEIERLLNKRTKAIIPVHYAGIACDMDEIVNLARQADCRVVEDAAQAISSKYKDKYLGTIGDFGTLSFHETKNIISGEGGLLIVNDPQYMARAEIIREKGTNRSSFFRGEVNKYEWQDIGSSFLPSDIIAAFLYAQLENLEEIQKKRIGLWNRYYKNLSALTNKIKLPEIPAYSTNNAHLFHIVCNSLKERSLLIDFLKENNVAAVFHYQALHMSRFYLKDNKYYPLKNAERFSDCLLRLPIHGSLDLNSVDYICSLIDSFYSKKQISN